MNISISPIFRPYLEEAIERFSYLHPGVDITATEGGIMLESADPGLIAEFRHTLYRQKIHCEAEPLRRSVIERLLR